MVLSVDLIVVATLGRRASSLVLVVKVVVLVSTTELAFLRGLVLLPMSEVLIDVTVLVLVVDGRLVTVLSVGARGVVMVLDLVIVFLPVFFVGRITLGRAALLPMSEVLMDVIVLVLTGDGLAIVLVLVMFLLTLLVGAGRFMLLAALGAAIALLLGAVIFLAGLDVVVFIWLVLTVDILLEEKLLRGARAGADLVGADRTGAALRIVVERRCVADLEDVLGADLVDAGLDRRCVVGLEDALGAGLALGALDRLCATGLEAVLGADLACGADLAGVDLLGDELLGACLALCLLDVCFPCDGLDCFASSNGWHTNTSSVAVRSIKFLNLIVLLVVFMRCLPSLCPLWA